LAEEYEFTTCDWLYGRRDIYTANEKLTRENILTEVNYALGYHFRNVFEEQYLYWYRRGFQPIVNRTKERNDFVLNKVTQNVAEEIVTFKNGYFLMENAFYTSRKSGKKTKVDKLNEYLYRSGKQAADNQLADWFHMVGKAALYVEPTDRDDIPLRAYALDPRSAFVVYSFRPGNRPVYGVNVVIADKDMFIDVYTDDTIFRLKGSYLGLDTTDRPMYQTMANEILAVEPNLLRHIPIIEYRYNSVNMGAFESVVTLLDAINQVQSDRVDGVDQFIQSLAIAVNCEFPDETTAADIRRAGMIALRSIGENKADFKILSEELNQDQTQTLVDNLYDQALRICAMPTASKQGRGTYDSTGQAAIFNNGWEQAASCARNTEDLFRESNRHFDAILVDVLKRKGLLDIDLVDFELNFVRNETANTQSKAQAAQTMLAMGLHPELALKKSGLSNDPVSDIKMSEKYLKMIWGDPDKVDKEYEQGNGQGEADIVESDNFNGENDTGGAV
jgi:SPP1 family phage portal protein